MTLETVAPVVWAFTGAFLLLWFATIAIFGLARLRAERDYTQLKLRVKTWWWILAVFAGTLFFQPVVGVVIFAFVSFLAFKEYLTLIPMRRADHAVLFLAYYSIPLHYLWIGLGWYGMFVIFIPIYMFLLLPMRMVLIGETEGFLRAAATIAPGRSE